jgi:cytoskeletal protein CcmA (bactofilin family)
MWGKTNDSNFKPLSMTQPASSMAAAVLTSERTQDRTQPERVQPVAAPPARASASIGKTTRIHGEIYSEEELFFDGEIDGAIEVRNLLTIGPNGKIKANVKAKELVVRGSIQGDVEATDRISIMNGASIVGDVKTAGIVIEDGAYFKGGIDILRPENAKVAVAKA